MIITLCTGVAAGVALGVSLAIAKRYTSTATLLVQTPVSASGQTQAAVPSLDPGREAETNQRLMSLPMIASRTARAVGGTTAAAVSRDISVKAEGDSYLYSISASANRPDLASKLANSYSEQFVAFRQSLDQARIRGIVAPLLREPGGRALIANVGLLARLSESQAAVVQSATPPADPSSPRTATNTVLGALLGLLVGVCVVLLMPAQGGSERRA
jgi:uncharacterized protein involved in exopolysaccharide biosynthesis